MSLYEKMLNISGKDIEENIKEVISAIKEEYKDLTDKQTCRYYSGLVYSKLKEKNITSRLVDTEDLNSSYSHMFVIALDTDKKYLIDLTYNQFKDDTDTLSYLKENGYILLDNDKWEHYLNVLPRENNFTIDEAIYGKEKKSR